MFSKLSQRPSHRTGSETHQLNTVTLSRYPNTPGSLVRALLWFFSVYHDRRSKNLGTSLGVSTTPIMVVETSSLSKDAKEKNSALMVFREAEMT